MYIKKIAYAFMYGKENAPVQTVVPSEPIPQTPEVSMIQDNLPEVGGVDQITPNNTIEPSETRGSYVPPSIILPPSGGTTQAPVSKPASKFKPTKDQLR